MTAIQTTGSTTTTPAKSGDGVDVRCLGLTKTFRDFWMRTRVRAVDNIDLDIRSGEVLGLLGPNGSGKSTTIKMILGLLNPTAGKIAVFGKHPNDVRTKKMIGYLPEESYLYRFLNARETLDYYGRLFHQSRDQRMRRIDELLNWVGLEGVQRRPIGEYSKGMQRRIGLAQALINDPKLLILDEPTTGMDPLGTRQIKDLILRLRDMGKTVLLCSHQLADVQDVCDRVAIMFGGKVRSIGPRDELLLQQEFTNIQTDTLPDEAIDEVRAVLEKHGKSILKLEQPRQQLETLFLEIVEKARSEGASTSGATSGGKFANFIGTEEAPAPVSDEEETERVVGDLLKSDKPEADATDDTSDADDAAEPVDTTADVVSSLVSGGAANQVEAADEAEPAEAEADVDQGVIDGLLGGGGAGGSETQGDAPAAKETASAPPAAPAPASEPASSAPASSERDESAESSEAPAAEQAEGGGMFAQELDREMGSRDGDAPEKAKADDASDEKPDESLRHSIDSLLDDDKKRD